MKTGAHTIEEGVTACLKKATWKAVLLSYDLTSHRSPCSSTGFRGYVHCTAGQQPHPPDDRPPVLALCPNQSNPAPQNQKIRPRVLPPAVSLSCPPFSKIFSHEDWTGHLSVLCTRTQPQSRTGSPLHHPDTLPSLPAASPNSVSRHYSKDSNDSNPRRLLFNGGYVSLKDEWDRLTFPWPRCLPFVIMKGCHIIRNPITGKSTAEAVATITTTRRSPTPKLLSRSNRDFANQQFSLPLSVSRPLPFLPSWPPPRGNSRRKYRHMRAPSSLRVAPRHCDLSLTFFPRRWKSQRPLFSVFELRRGPSPPGPTVERNETRSPAANKKCG
ncbi:hypothetical protein H6P81_011541 [Aristolochia fimbriata]|uniref:Uncharacterized protein n=1 Tax=Aristolochia fimbriata TaxID=158543 RepID=A0AAV7EV99_ARIFI|nr:hypothetical protein H6P81_011541 [Aristolochia fimbriata]